jgi:hypothetical protein
MTFRVGQKVVCVDDEAQPCNRGYTPVVKGDIYTIRDAFDWFGLDGIRLEEIKNPHDRGYQARRFRPVVERKTDISFAHEILNSVNQGVDA